MSNGDEFHLPYNFVPADTRKTPTEDAAQIRSGTGNHPARHDLWARDRYSGRIFCRIRTESPLVIGARQTPANGGPATVEPYLRDGKPAIPGNSLRGMVGSLVEAISQSALRKLHQPKISESEGFSYIVRRPADSEDHGALSAIGMLQYTAKGYRLIPLSMPVAVDGSTNPDPARFKVCECWRNYLKRAVQSGIPLEHFLPTYVHGYHGTSQTGNGIARTANSFLARESPESYRASRDVRYYVDKYPAQIAELKGEKLVITATDQLHRSSNRPGTSMLLNVIRRGDHAIGRERRDDRTEGILKVLGADDQLDEIPSTKHHEFFLPWSEARSRLAESIALPPSVVRRFLALLNERAEYAEAELGRGRTCVLPLLNNGMEFPDFTTTNLDGELVFFELGQHESNFYAKNIAFSSVWRRTVAGTLFDAFRRHGGNDVLPWGAQWTEKGETRARERLTPAELLFGVATDRKPPPGTNRLAALAGRVRFHDATLADGQSAERDPPETLQILSSPKPPSAPFYFAHCRPNGVFKQQLNLDEHAPNGRKFYLPHREADLRSRPWRHAAGQADDADNQRVRVTPIPAGRVFFCHIDFEHLRANELELLIAALQPGDAQQKQAGFRHRLGLGKPLGLGQIRLEVKAVCRFVRQNRYAAAALGASRYEDVFITPDASAPGCELDDWLRQPHYRCERQALYESATKVSQHSLSAETPMTAFRVKDGSLINKAAADAAFTLGNRSKVVAPVQYPRCLDQVGDETRLFAWNAENDKSRDPQWLVKVTPGAALPTLRRVRSGRANR
ncbi:MAG: hypothetical protein AMXMBFR59_38520 [Rhodanobacteraceae bacterium]